MLIEPLVAEYEGGSEMFAIGGWVGEVAGDKEGRCSRGEMAKGGRND